ncbi:MAG: ChaN family lipoprotein [Pikeienuella sp.]
MRATALALFGLIAACAASSAGPAPTGHPLEGRIFELAGGREIDEAALAARLAVADIAILGEVHDNAAHHRRQARLVAALEPAGVAFEMVPEASEEGVAVFLEQGGAAAEVGPAIGWERLGWPDWALYRPVFEAASGAYLAGGGVAQDRISLAMRVGAVAGFGPGAGEYGLTEPLAPAERAAAEAEMVAAHCDMLPAEVAGPMVEAQRLRDARFAHAARRASRRGGGKAVLITGNGHARTDRGVPAYLAAREPGLVVRALAQIEVDPRRQGIADYARADLPYDYVWFSPPVARPDPCEAFR